MSRDPSLRASSLNSSATQTSTAGRTVNDCDRCNGGGTYFILPRGNPFAMRIEVLEHAMVRRFCWCPAGRAALAAAKTGGAA